MQIFVITLLQRSMVIVLDILLQSPPAGIDFAIQKGSGNAYETIQKQRSDGQDIRFSFYIDLKNDSHRVNQPRFTGPIAQGKPADQFIYIDMGLYAGQTDGEWNGRIKVPLSGISWEIIDDLKKHPGTILSTAFPGSAKKGGPIFATVKNFKGWELDVLAQ